MTYLVKKCEFVKGFRGQKGLNFEVRNSSGDLYSTHKVEEDAEIVAYGLNHGFTQHILGGFADSVIEEIKAAMTTPKIEKIKLTIINKFHNTEASFYAQSTKHTGLYSVPTRTLSRLDKKLCPHGRGKSCGCAGMDRPAKAGPDFVIGEIHEGRAWVTVNDMSQ